MKTIVVTDETLDLLRAHARTDVPFNDTSYIYDGQRWLELDEEMYARLAAMRLPGESFDTVIRQLFTRGTA